MIICVDFKSRYELKNKNCKNNYGKYTMVHYFVNQVGRIFFFVFGAGR